MDKKIGPVIGNDIVDLRFVESPGYRHIEHLERVCSTSELSAIRKSANPSRSLAILWASKEAAYKLLVQEGIAGKFVPRQFVANFEDGSESRYGREFVVNYFGTERKVRAWITEDWVHAIAMFPERNISRSLVCEIKNDWPGGREALCESDTARRLAAKLLTDCNQNVVLEFTAGIPVARRTDGSPAGIGLSLSHHGSYAAAAIALIPETNFRPQLAGHVSTETSMREELCFISTA